MKISINDVFNKGKKTRKKLTDVFPSNKEMVNRKSFFLCSEKLRNLQMLSTSNYSFDMDVLYWEESL